MKQGNKASVLVLAALALTMMGSVSGVEQHGHGHHDHHEPKPAMTPKEIVAQWNTKDLESLRTAWNALTPDEREQPFKEALASNGALDLEGYERFETGGIYEKILKSNSGEVLQCDQMNIQTLSDNEKISIYDTMSLLESLDISPDHMLRHETHKKWW